MDKLKAAIQQLADIDAKIDAILANPTLTEEQLAEHNALVAERAKVVALVERERNKLAREEERAKMQAEADRLEQEKATVQAAAKDAEEKKKRQALLPQNRITDPDRPTGSMAVATQPAAEVRTVIPATVRRFKVQNFRDTPGGYRAEEKAYRFGMWTLSRLATDMPNRFRFPKAVEWAERNMAAVTSHDSSGYQLLIPEEFGQDLIVLRELYGVARRLFKQVPMVSDTRTDPRRKSGLTAYFTAEGAAGTESNKNWDNVRLVAKDLMVLSRYTNQVAADAVINIGDDLAGEISYAFANKEDDCAFNGDGTSTFGGIRGLRRKIRDWDGNGTDSVGLVAAATTGSWGAIVLSDFNTVVGKLPQYAEVAGQIAWSCHRAFYYAVMQKLELAAGGVTAREVQYGGGQAFDGMTKIMPLPRPLFLGYPVEFSQIFDGSTGASQVCALFGNYQKAASFGDRQQDEIAFSEHATVGGENVFERNQIAIRGTQRFDINCHDVGDSTNPGPVVGLRT